jgi:hypothetical protein
MNWIALGVAGGILHWLYWRGSRAAESKQATPAGQQDAPEPDAVKAALESNDLDQLMTVADSTKDPVDQHLVLSNIINQTYKARSDASMHAILLEKGRHYIDIFGELFEPLKVELGKDVYRNAVFKQMAIALDEDGEYDEAVAVCRTAMEYKLHDGTKTGFQGRIARIQKKQATQ